MLVKDICCHDVAFAQPRTSIQAASEQMAADRVGTLVIVDKKHVPHGIVTDRDIVTRVLANGLDPAATSVSDVMAHPVVSVRESANAEVALSCMTFGVRRIPVVDDGGRLVGIVSLDDFLLMHASIFGQVKRTLQKELKLPVDSV